MNEAKFDSKRRLCPDGSCIGVVGDDGRCRVCGRDAGGGKSAAAAADALVTVAGVRDVRILAASTSPRAARLLKSSPPHVIVAAPAELVALLQSSALKADSVRAVALAWLDMVLGTAEAEPLETLFGELPKEGARIVLAAELSPAYEALIERYARRARREVAARTTCSSCHPSACAPGIACSG